MTSQAASLQSFNSQLVKMLDELCARRKALQKDIDGDIKEAELLRKQLEEVTKKLQHVESRLQSNAAKKDQYDKLISDTEKGYQRILASSHTLLNVVQNEANDLGKE